MSEESVFAPATLPPPLEVVVNFGIVVGREASDDEIEQLGELLLPEATTLAVVAERRREFGRESQASMHQVRIEVDEQAAASLSSDQHDRIRAIAERWVRACQEHPTARTLAERLAQSAVSDAQEEHPRPPAA